MSLDLLGTIDKAKKKEDRGRGEPHECRDSNMVAGGFIFA